jgi:hypothetical protein
MLLRREGQSIITVTNFLSSLGYKRGYKVSIIQHVKSKIIVSVIITSANVADNRLLLTTVLQAVTILEPGVIKTLIFDKGYWDGNSLTKLKKTIRNFAVIHVCQHYPATFRVNSKIWASWIEDILILYFMSFRISDNIFLHIFR